MSSLSGSRSPGGFWRGQLQLLKPTRVQGITWALMVLIPAGIVAGLDAAGVLHPRVHGFWPFAAVTLLGLIGLSLPVVAAIRQDNVRWNAIPVCGACGRKMIPAQVRVTWWTRLRYYRCDCAREGRS